MAHQDRNGSKATSFAGEALQIIDENLNLNTRNLEKIFSSVGDRKFAVATVSGVTRKGKSFLLNFIVRHVANENKEQLFTDFDLFKEKGFQCSNSSTSVTNGIWMWSQPLEVPGLDYPVLLMDTQGTFGTNMDRNLSMKIFAISALISSLLMYNLQGNINNNDLENLDSFAIIAQECCKLNGNVKPFQKLLFLIRDGQMDDHEYGFDGGNDYVTKILMSESAVNERILSAFINPSGFLMPHPGNAVARGKITKFSEIPEDFGTHMNDFIKGILTKQYLKPKKVSGNAINGKQMTEYIERLVTLFNTKSELTLSDMFETATEISIAKAKESYISQLMSYKLHPEQSPETEYRQFTVNELFNAIESFAANPIRFSVAIKPIVFNEVIAELKEAYTKIPTNVNVNIMNAVKVYKDAFAKKVRNKMTANEILMAHHTSTTDALTHFVKDKERLCEVNDKHINKLFENIWNAFTEQFELIKKENEFQEMSLKAEIEKIFAELCDSYRRAAKAFQQANERFPNNSEIEQMHSDTVKVIKKNFTKTLKGKLEEKEIIEYLSYLLTRLDEEKQRIKADIFANKEKYDAAVGAERDKVEELENESKELMAKAEQDKRELQAKMERLGEELERAQRPGFWSNLLEFAGEAVVRTVQILVLHRVSR